MTDDELRRALAERLGYSLELSPWAANSGIDNDWAIDAGLPSLSELVATGEGRLTATQQGDYAYLMEGLTGWDEYSLTAQFRLITAPVAVRARALLETLPEP